MRYDVRASSIFALSMNSWIYGTTYIRERSAGWGEAHQTGDLNADVGELSYLLEGAYFVRVCCWGNVLSIEASRY